MCIHAYGRKNINEISVQFTLITSLTHIKTERNQKQKQNVCLQKRKKTK